MPTLNEDTERDGGFPIIPAVDAKTLMRKMLELAISSRAAIAVVAQKSAGKTFSLERVIDEWDAEQLQQQLATPGHVPQRIVLVGRLKAHSERDCLIAILTALRGAPPHMRMRGGRKTDAQLLSEIVSTCLEQNVVALLVEEGEYITDAGMTVIRDVITEAALADRRKGGTEAGGMERGVGVLAVGAPSFRRIVDQHAERGHRWPLIEEIGLVPPALAPDIYLTWFPRWKEHVDVLTMPRWRLYIDTVVTGGQPLPVGRLIRHAQLYLEAVRGMGPRVPRTEAPFSAQLFERLWHRPADGAAA
ncbi:MAG: hypothetical protein K2R93_16005 [Gemmatimonadaceae bacterium]|nr:hypothetical protein [Gemmatimonadaceae bacterium]